MYKKFLKSEMNNSVPLDVLIRLVQATVTSRFDLGNVLLNGC